MVLPRWLARFNRRFTNRVLGVIPRRWSPFVELCHVGRDSGRSYVTLVAAFRSDGGFVLTPTYGPEADWVRNILAAESCSMDRRGEVLVLTGACLVDRAEAWLFLPLAVRQAMRLMRVEWFVRVDQEHS